MPGERPDIPPKVIDLLARSLGPRALGAVGGRPEVN